MRELSEETAIELSNIWTDPNFRFDQFYDVTTKKQTVKRKQLVIYLAWLKKDCTIRATEHLGHRWFDWSPPHSIQARTIDPLLEQVHTHFQKQPTWPFDGVFDLGLQT